MSLLTRKTQWLWFSWVSAGRWRRFYATSRDLLLATPTPRISQDDGAQMKIELAERN